MKKRILRPLTDAERELVENNVRLAYRRGEQIFSTMSKKYSYLTFTKEDIQSIASYALCIAAQKFDDSKGFKFSTYAYGWIDGMVSREVEYGNSVVKVPTLRAKKEEQRDYAEILRHVMGDTTLTVRLGETLPNASRVETEGLTYSDVIADRQATEAFDAIDLIESAKPVIADLRPCEKYVIYRRHFDGATYAEMEKECGVADTALRKQYSSALKKLRQVISPEQVAWI